MVDTSKISNEVLTAYLDGELGKVESSKLAKLIELDPPLRRRLEQLKFDNAVLVQAFDGLKVPDLDSVLTPGRNPVPANSAPQVSTRPPPAMVSGERKASPRQDNAPGWSKARMSLAAGFLLAVFSAGYFVNEFVLPLRNLPLIADNKPVKQGWRQSVAVYVSLFTTETLNRSATAASMVQQELATLSRDIGLPLPPNAIQVDGLAYKRGELLSLDNQPLVQLAYLYEGKTPVAFCIIRSSKGKKAMEFEQRNGLEVAYWRSDNFSFMVLGDLPKEALAEIAKGFSISF